MNEPKERGSPKWCTWANKRIVRLEAVAEAAEVYSHLNNEGTCDELASYYAASNNLDDALRAAGYLKEDKPQ